ncbi:uncharacterized protein [Montipora foliosa]|uniref:uncharacterized protein n=1 Tax=Montipora foliosa TaxID=591990 RepID=UPI0035F1DFD1
MRLSTVTLFLSFAILLMALSIVARGRGGGRSGGSRFRSSSRRSSSGSKSSKPTITKYTPIKATTVRSPVIRSQTKVGSKRDTFKKAVTGYLLYHYTLSNARVYRSGYPMYRCYVTVPEKRAVRIISEEQRLLDSRGRPCVGPFFSQTFSLEDDIDQHLISMTTNVTYKKTGETKTYHNDTVSLKDILEQDFEVKTLSRYNITIVPRTSCSQVEETIEGTMITLYETNPNKASSRYTNVAPTVLLATVIALWMSPVFELFQIKFALDVSE